MLAFLVTGLIAIIAGGIVWHEVRVKHLNIWMGTYLRARLRKACGFEGASSVTPVHVLFCIVDHFEPVAEGSTVEQERERMRDWLTRYPALARRHKDSEGRSPQHTWFYPGENYRAEYLDDLVTLCQQGLGEIELHLHHGYDTSDSLREKLLRAIYQFNKHGALITQDVPSKQVYGFIHGNMALDNSMDNQALCGVDAEITVLRETGCYADFSMPTAPAISQSRKINAVYYSTDDPSRSKSHDTGIDVEVGRTSSSDLMIIQGPLGINWYNRKGGVIPKIENGELQASNPPSLARILNWVQQHVHVKGRPEWVIVKVSCHGAEDRSRDVLLGDIADEMYSLLEQQYRDQLAYRLHYVTARELYNIIKAAEAGLMGNPALYRDYVIPPYQTHSEDMLSRAAGLK
ncbi:hypothetical protein [Nitrospira sp. Nam74]